jgi:hypothetical protein
MHQQRQSSSPKLPKVSSTAQLAQLSDAWLTISTMTTRNFALNAAMKMVQDAARE